MEAEPTLPALTTTCSSGARRWSWISSEEDETRRGTAARRLGGAPLGERREVPRASRPEILLLFFK